MHMFVASWFYTNTSIITLFCTLPVHFCDCIAHVSGLKYDYNYPAAVIVEGSTRPACPSLMLARLKIPTN